MIKDAHWVKGDSDFQQNLSITLELPIESYALNRMDMRAEMGEIIFEELHTYLKENHIKP